MIDRAVTPEARATLVAYIASKVGATPEAVVGHMPFEIVAVKRNGRVMGAVLYTNWRSHTIEMTAAGEPGWLTKGTIRQFFEYPFVQLGVYTVITTVQRKNSASRELQKRLGFSELGTIPVGVKELDNIIYTMTRGQCHWITQGVDADAA